MLEKMKEIIAEQLGVDASDVELSTSLKRGCCSKDFWSM